MNQTSDVNIFARNSHLFVEKSNSIDAIHLSDLANKEDEIEE